jgi:hypothetical protein
MLDMDFLLYEVSGQQGDAQHEVEWRTALRGKRVVDLRDERPLTYRFTLARRHAKDEDGEHERRPCRFDSSPKKHGLDLRQRAVSSMMAD